jgi:hypothetical protein
LEAAEEANMKIEQTVIGGRKATVIYLTSQGDEFHLVDKEQASLKKIVFDDGELRFVNLKPATSE